MSHDLETEITKLDGRLIDMFCKAEQRVTMAFNSWKNKNEEHAKHVCATDGEIDRYEIKLDNKCFRILALQQPVATDLRFVLSAVQMTTDIERIGDYAKSIAKRTLCWMNHNDTPVCKLMPLIMDEVSNMLQSTRDALISKNVDDCQQIRELDDVIDEYNYVIIKWAQVELNKPETTSEGLLDLVTICKSIERIADHCTNIAEHIIFAENGEIVKHPTA